MKRLILDAFILMVVACLIGFCVLCFLPLAHPQESRDITFQANSIPEVNVFYDDYSFVFSYKSFFIRVKPFAIFNGSYYDMKQIVTWIKSTYPSVDYKWLVNKATHAIHYGFNLTRLPQNVADHVDYLGFRLVDLNFPLSWFELEKITVFDELQYNITLVKIPKANLLFSFEDLYPYGYSIEHVNSTYILVGSVKGRTDLYFDPITYSSGVVTVVGTYTDLLDDIYDADVAGGWNVFHKQGDRQFFSDARIVIGDGSTSTTVSDSLATLEFNSSLTGYNLIEQDNSIMTFGILVDEDNKVTRDGITIIHIGNNINVIFAPPDSTTYLYSCSIYCYTIWNPRHNLVLQGEGRVWNGVYSGIDFVEMHLVKDFSVYGVRLCADRWAIKNCDCLIENSFISTYKNAGTGQTFLVYIYGLGNATIKNVDGRWSTKTFYVAYYHAPKEFHAVNCDFGDSWTFTWVNCYGGEIIRDYEFDVNLLFENQTAIANCNVSLTDAEGIELFNLQTNSSGQISTQTVAYAFYNETGGDTPYLKSPHTLKIFRKGIRMYESVFNITDKTDLTLTLTPRGWVNQTGTEGITYGSGVITVTGFTENSPCTFQSICDANDQYGWNVIDALGNNTFVINGVELNVGDGSTETWFKDGGVQVLWYSETQVDDAVGVYNNAHFILGDVVNETLKTTRNRSSLMTKNYWYFYLYGGEMSLYDVSILCLDEDSSNWANIIYDESSIHSNVWNCRFNSIYAFDVYENANVSLYKVEIKDSETNHSLDETITLEDVTYRNSGDNMFIISFYSGEDLTIKNLVASNATYDMFYIVDFAQDVNMYLINADLDEWTFNFYESIHTTIYRQYEHDFTITYPNGTAFENADVTITYEGQSGGSVGSWLTNSTGQIPTQTLSRSFYNASGDDSEYAYYPFNITITATGYDTYTKRWIPTEKTTWEVALIPTSAEVAGFNDVYYLLGGISLLPFALLFALLLRRREKNGR